MKKKDYIIIGSLLIIGVISLLFVLFYDSGAKNTAYVYNGSSVIIKVDFKESSYVYSQQENNYPIVSTLDNGNILIIILGDYHIDGQKTELGIEIDFNNNQIRIAYDSTPEQIGVNRGWYNGSGLPVISAPNNVYIIFENENDVDGVV